MRWAITLGKIRGTPIRAHVTLIAVFVMLTSSYGWMGIPLGLILFFSVLLHELGHAFVAERHGIPIARIDLHILGGMTLMNRHAHNPRQELEVAAGGPAVSLMLAAIGAAAAWAVSAPMSFTPMTWRSLLVFMAVLNVGMAIFNLVPALPTDGGRIFRALMSMRFGHQRATRIAVWVSGVFAVMLIVAGAVKGQLLLIVLGAVLILMAVWEQRAGRLSPEEEIVQAVARAGSDRNGPQPAETSEEYIDAQGQHYVVVTRLVR